MLNLRSFSLIFSYLPKKCRSNLVLAIFSIIFTAFAEALSLMLIVPFFKLANIYLSSTSYTPKYSFNLPLDLIISFSDFYKAALFFIFIIFIAGVMRIFNLFFLVRISAQLSVYLSDMVFNSIYSLNFLTFKRKSNSYYTALLTDYIERTSLSINALLQLVSALFISVAIISTMLSIQPYFTITICLLCGLIYFGLGLKFKSNLWKNSIAIADNQAMYISNIEDSIQLFTHIRLDRKLHYFSERLKKFSHNVYFLQANNTFLGAFPRYTVESFILIFFTLIFLTAPRSVSSSNIFILSLAPLVVGFQKLMPSFQQLYAYWSFINASKSELRHITSFLRLRSSESVPHNLHKYETATHIINGLGDNFNSLELRNICYTYSNLTESSDDLTPAPSSPIISELNFKINARDWILIRGPSGSGKSTFISLLLGLIIPSSGEIILNSFERGSNRSILTHEFWQTKIAYIPQSSYITNQTLIENIALGKRKKHIDYDRIIEACHIACATEFIDTLPDKYETLVGSKSLNLSGGQAQRIAIARALYANKPILVMDESTSAIDTTTENTILQNISKYHPNITVFFITHRDLDRNLFNKQILFKSPLNDSID